MADHHGVELVYAPAVADYVVARCLVQETGARLMIGFIEQHLLPALSRHWLDALISNRRLARIEIEMASVDPDAAPAEAIAFRLVDDGLPLDVSASAEG
ncbi:hypothetical protein [Burkholderia glumae]